MFIFGNNPKSSGASLRRPGPISNFTYEIHCLCICTISRRMGRRPMDGRPNDQMMSANCRSLSSALRTAPRPQRSGQGSIRRLLRTSYVHVRRIYLYIKTSPSTMSLSAARFTPRASRIFLLSFIFTCFFFFTELDLRSHSLLCSPHTDPIVESPTVVSAFSVVLF